MNQIYPDEGLLPLLDRMLTASVQYHLFENNVTPDRDTVLGDLTEVSTFGYAAQTVALAGWTLQSVAGHVGTFQAAPLAFTPAGGAWSVYGYYVTSVAGGVLLAVGRFDGAPIAVPDGVPILVNPIMAAFSKNAS